MTGQKDFQFVHMLFVSMCTNSVCVCTSNTRTSKKDIYFQLYFQILHCCKNDCNIIANIRYIAQPYSAHTLTTRYTHTTHTSHLSCSLLARVLYFSENKQCMSIGSTACRSVAHFENKIEKMKAETLGFENPFLMSSSGGRLPPLFPAQRIWPTNDKMSCDSASAVLFFPQGDMACKRPKHDS